MSDPDTLPDDAEMRRMVLGCDDACEDVYEHDLFLNRRGNFRWCWPRFTVYVPADKHARWMLNRYPHNVIGAAVVLFGRCWGVQWRR